MDLINPYAFGKYPQSSIDFESGSSQYLNMSSANFGAYNRAKFAVSAWYRRESTGAAQVVMGKYSGAGNREWRLLFSAGNTLTFEASEAGTSLSGRLITTATYTDTTNFHHILAWYDSANATAGDRMRLWHDGTEVTSFGTDVNPAAAAFTGTNDMTVGWESQSGGYFDGLLYQLAFFSGTLPDISTVYNAGSPMDVRNLTGLYALLDVAGGSVVSDYVLATDWTNNNTAVASTTIP